MHALQALARKPLASFNQMPRRDDGKKNEAFEVLTVIWNYVLKQPVSEIKNIIRGPCLEVKDEHGVVIRNTFPSQVLFLAAEMGNSTFIEHLIYSFPDSIRMTDDHNRSIFHIAVMHRQESVYNILYEIGSIRDFITSLKDDNGNNMLHLAACKPKHERLPTKGQPLNIVQREVQWFKDVEAMLPPWCREEKNKDNQTPRELFRKEHELLLSDVVDKVKNSIEQCMVVGALIATVAFAAAFTVPGGYNQDTGIPILFGKDIFTLYLILDAISLGCSSASLVVNLSIITANYGEEAYLVQIPNTMLLARALVLCSITTMCVAFCESLFIFYPNGLTPILIGLFVGCPIILFCQMQSRDLLDIFRATYGSWYLFTPKNRVLL